MVTALGRVLRGPLVPSVFVAVILAGVTPGTSQGGGTVVPLDLSGRRAMVEVTVNGTGPHTFVVASTFTGVAIERSFAVELGLVEAAPDSESVWDHPAVDVTLDWIQLGDLTFGKVPAEAYGDEMQFLGRNPRGTLGLELFRDHLVTYDLAVGEFRLSQGALPEPNDDDVFAYEKHGVQDATEPELTPVIPATVAGKQMMIGLHTGFIGSLQLNSSLMDELPLSGEAGRIGNIGTDKGEAELLGTSLDGDFVVAGQTFASPPVYFSDLYTNPSLGSGGLADFVLEIDQENGRLRLTRDESREAVMFENAAKLQNLSGEDVDLRAAFNEDPDKIRMVLILSPT